MLADRFGLPLSTSSSPHETPMSMPPSGRWHSISARGAWKRPSGCLAHGVPVLPAFRSRGSGRSS